MRKTKQEPQKPQQTPDRTREYIAYGVALLSLWFSLEYAIAGYRAHEQARLLREYVDRKINTPPPVSEQDAAARWSATSGPTGAAASGSAPRARK